MCVHVCMVTVAIGITNLSSEYEGVMCLLSLLMPRAMAAIPHANNHNADASHRYRKLACFYAPQALSLVGRCGDDGGRCGDALTILR